MCRSCGGVPARLSRACSTLAAGRGLCLRHRRAGSHQRRTPPTANHLRWTRALPSPNRPPCAAPAGLPQPPPLAQHCT
eukprot:scaffold516_cov401-Prasinococcus_capsulatus_cf.AAC.30